MNLLLHSQISALAPCRSFASFMNTYYTRITLYYYANNKEISMSFTVFTHKYMEDGTQVLSVIK